MTLDNMIFLQIFPQHLLSNIHQGLFTEKGKLTTDELANLADEFIASPPAARSVNEVTFTETEQFAELFAKLTIQVNALQNQVQLSRRITTNNKQRYRSRSRLKGREDIYYCHKLFKEASNKCLQPCNFSKVLNSKGEL